MRATSSPSPGLGSAIFLLLFAVPFLGVGMFAGYRLAQTVLDAQAMKAWRSVPAVLESAELLVTKSSKNKRSTRLQASYRYEIDGTTRTAHRVGLDDSATVGSNEERYAALQRLVDSKQPTTAFVNPADPNDAVLFPELSARYVLTFLVLTALFGGIGVLFAAGALHSARSALVHGRLAQRYPSEPWRHRPEWESGSIPSKSGSTLFAATLIGSFITLLSVPILTVLPEELRRGNYGLLFTLIFPAIGLGFFYWAATLALSRRRFGDPRCDLTTFPGRIGGTLEAQIRCGRPIPSGAAARVRLCCTLEKHVKKSRSKHRSARTNMLWQDEREVQTDGECIPVSFDIPAHATPTGDDGRNRVRWRLYANADLPGADFRSEFEVPVY